MKIPFTFFALFATQIIPLKAGINGRKNLLVRGSLRPQLKFWRNPFGSSKAEPENPKQSITGTFRVQGTATLKNGKIELDISLGNEIAPETGLMPPAGPTTGTTIEPTASGPTSSAGTSTPSGGPTSASSTPPPVGGPTSASSSPPPLGGPTSASGTPPPAVGPTSASSTPPPAGGSTTASGTPPVVGGSTSPSSTPPPAGGSTTASGTPPPAAGSTSPSTTPPPAGGSTTASGTPPVVGGSTSASSTSTPAGGSTSASVTPPPAAGSTSASSTPPPAGGSTSLPGSTTPKGPTTASSGSTPSITLPTIGTSGPTAGTSAATSAAAGSSTLPTSKPTPPATPPTPATTKPTAPVKICITPGQVYVIIVAKGVMAAHNSVRRTHGSPALQLDEQMTCDAQHFAQQMASRGVLEHQTSSILARKRVGENIGMSCTPARNGPLSFQKIKKMVGNVAKRWYDEVCDYNFDKPNFAPRVGHFTEVVWSNSKKLGVGYAVGKNAKFPGYVCVYVVGRYRPAGNNMESQRLEKNVKRGNFNNAYCTRRSKAPAFTLIPVDKRNQLQAS